MSDSAFTRNYYLDREIEKARAKHKPIAIVLPQIDPVEGQHAGFSQRTVQVTSPVLWTDDVSISAQVNPPGAARQLLGDDGYDHWQAAGGTAGILFDIIRDSQGAASMGESGKS